MQNEDRAPVILHFAFSVLHFSLPFKKPLPPGEVGGYLPVRAQSYGEESGLSSKAPLQTLGELPSPARRLATSPEGRGELSKRIRFIGGFGFRWIGGFFSWFTCWRGRVAAERVARRCFGRLGRLTAKRFPRRRRFGFAQNDMHE